MKLIIVLTLTSIAYGAKLDNIYLPPNSRGAAAGGEGISAPNSQGSNFQSLGNQASAYSSQNEATILRLENEMDEQGYHYAYETSDGTKVDQQGRIIPGATEEEGSLVVSGSYSYVGDDGQTYTVTYTADENGYRAEGAHLPTSPPIPEAILKSLEVTNRRNGEAHYDSQRSSYDADNGY